MKKNKIILLLTILVFYSCNNSNNVSKKIHEDNSTNIDNEIFLDVSMDKDTLKKGKSEKGVINFLSIVNDTIQLNERDKRRIYLTLALIPDDKTQIDSSTTNKFSNEIVFTKINNENDSLKIPFKITPKFEGNGTILGIVEETLELNNYGNEEEIRVITTEYTFEKKVIIESVSYGQNRG